MFANERPKVVVSDIDEKDGKEVVNQIKNNGDEVFFFNTDASNPEEQEALVKATTEKYGALNITFNNHGVIGITKSDALKYSNKNVRINAVGPEDINTPYSISG